MLNGLNSGLVPNTMNWLPYHTIKIVDAGRRKPASRDDPWFVGSCLIRKPGSNGEVSQWLVFTVPNAWSSRQSWASG